MRSLLSLLTYDNTMKLPTNCVITKVYFDLNGSEQVHCDIVNADGKYITVCLSNHVGRLQVELLQLTRPLTIRQQSRIDDGSFTVSFSKEDIIQFVTEVRDVNKIHREFPFIVPGLLILESLWNHYKENKSVTGLEVKYRSPMIADDRAHIVVQPNGYSEGLVDDIVLFKFRVHHEHNSVCID